MRRVSCVPRVVFCSCELLSVYHTVRLYQKANSSEWGFCVQTLMERSAVMPLEYLHITGGIRLSDAQRRAAWALHCSPKRKFPCCSSTPQPSKRGGVRHSDAQLSAACAASMQSEEETALPLVYTSILTADSSQTVRRLASYSMGGINAVRKEIPLPLLFAKTNVTAIWHMAIMTNAESGCLSSSVLPYTSETMHQRDSNAMHGP